MAFDLYPLETMASRKRYYQQAVNSADAPEKWLTVFTHDDATPWAYVGKDDKGRFVAGKPE